ncbi:MAG: hypothetical protein ACPF9R_04390 [Acholeplasmataceae bacterium]
MKTIIISQPKSGTYLCSNVLKNLGINQTYLHIAENKSQQYDGSDLKNCVCNPRQYDILKPISEILKLINDNDFCASHLEPIQSNINVTKNFKKIILTRNSIEDADKSWRAWLKYSGRTMSNSRGRRCAVNWKEHSKTWLKEKDTFHLTFEDMINKDTKKIDALQMFLFNETRFDSLSVIEKSLREPSMTKSKNRENYT